MSVNFTSVGEYLDLRVLKQTYYGTASLCRIHGSGKYGEESLRIDSMFRTPILVERLR